MQTRLVDILPKLSQIDKELLLEKIWGSQAARWEGFEHAVSISLTFETRFAAVTSYIGNENNIKTDLYIHIADSITEILRQKREPAQAANLLNIEVSDADKVFIFEHIRRHTNNSWGIHQMASSAESRLLLRKIHNESCPLASKWDAFIYYYSNQANDHRHTQYYIGKALRALLDKKIEDHIANQEFDEAYKYVFNNLFMARKIIIHSILHGGFKKEYLANYDLSKKANDLDYYQHQVLEKSVHCVISTERADTKGSAAAESAMGKHFWTLGATFIPQLVIRAPIAFFTARGRDFKKAQTVIIFLQKLSLLSAALSPEEKRQLIKEVCIKYGSQNNWQTSRSSQTLLALLQFAAHPRAIDNEIERAWKAIIEYTLSETPALMSNNGKRLFNTIMNKVQEAAQTLESRSLSNASLPLKSKLN